MGRYLIPAIAASVVSIISIGFALYEYQHILSIEEELMERARLAGAAERCHTCPYATAGARANLQTASVVGGTTTAIAIALFVIDRATSDKLSSHISNTK